MTEQNILDMFSSRASRATTARLKSIGSKSLFKAALDCMIESVQPVDQEVLMSELTTRNDPLGPPRYLEESTVSVQANPDARASFQHREGFKSSGHVFNLTTPFEWSVAKDLPRNTNYKLQSWQMLDAQIVAASMGHEDPHLQVALNIALDWIDVIMFKRTKMGFIWYDMAVGQRATKIAYLARKALMNGHGPDTVLPLIVAADLHMIELMQEDKIAMHSNHGLFQMAGLLALAASLPYLRHAQAGMELAGSKIATMLENHFGKDGLHLEHSPEYHIFMTNYVSQISELGWLEGSADLSALAERAIAATPWLIQPDGHILPFGDSKNIPATQRLRYSFPQLKESGVRAFAHGGLAVSCHLDNEGNMVEQLALTAQFHSRQHKHADDLALHFSAKGRQILVDSGTYSYQYADPRRMYVESTRAHNTIEFDGQNTTRFSKDVYGSALGLVAKVGPLAILNGVVRHTSLNTPDHPNNTYRPWHRHRVEVTHMRTLLHFADQFLLVLDELTSPVEHDYIQWFHLAPDLSLNNDEEGVLTCTDSTDNVLCSFQAIASLDDIMLVHEQTEPRLQGWTGMEGHSLEPSNAVGFKARGSKSTLATLISLHPEEETAQDFTCDEIGFTFSAENEIVPFRVRVGRSAEGHLIEVSTGQEQFERMISSESNDNLN